MCNHHDFHRSGIDRRRFLAGSLCLLALLGLNGPAHATASPVDLPPPGPYDTCPVCGMFPAKYPDWIATVLFKDGHADHFDGAKDFFKYLLDMKKYAKDRASADIVGLGVTDYYASERIDARQALYVVGSDVLSPMGHDLIPHPSAADAAEFFNDHSAKKTVRYDEVSLAMLLGLDNGEFGA